MDFGSVSGWVRRGGWFDYHVFVWAVARLTGVVMEVVAAQRRIWFLTFWLLAF